MAMTMCGLAGSESATPSRSIRGRAAMGRAYHAWIMDGAQGCRHGHGLWSWSMVMADAACGLLPCSSAPQSFEQLRLVDHFHAQRPRFFQLGAGIAARHHERGLLGNAGCHLGAGFLERARRLLAR